MPAVDSLLKVVEDRGAEAIIVASDEVPMIRRAGTESPLSMPPIGRDLVGVFLGEVMPEHDRDRLESGQTLTASYQTGNGARYKVRVERHGAGIRLTFVKPTSSVAAAPGAPRSKRGSSPNCVSPERRDASVPARGNSDVVSAPHANLLELCEQVANEGASDLFLSAGADARMRVDGRLTELPASAMTEEEILNAFAGSLDESARATLEASGSVDFAFEPRPGERYRVNVYRQCEGIAAALRPIRRDIPSLEELNLPASLQSITEHPNGLVLVTGMAGSGKSTTLVALVEQVNRTRAKHIITLEDPIEYAYQSRRSLIHQREVGAHVVDFATGLRAALRESPDMILLGEMRDRETIQAALTAAETGHLVLATLHASNAMVAIDRIIDIFPDGQQRQIRMQLSIVLRETLTQYLLPSGRGTGRVPAYERMIKTDAVAACIRDDKTHQLPSAIQTGRAEGMVPLELSLARLVRAGHLSLQTALQVAVEPAYFEELLRGIDRVETLDPKPHRSRGAVPR